MAMSKLSDEFWILLDAPELSRGSIKVPGALRTPGMVDNHSKLLGGMQNDQKILEPFGCGHRNSSGESKNGNVLCSLGW